MPVKVTAVEQLLPGVAPRGAFVIPFKQHIYLQRETAILTTNTMVSVILSPLGIQNNQLSTN